MLSWQSLHQLDPKIIHMISVVSTATGKVLDGKAEHYIIITITLITFYLCLYSLFHPQGIVRRYLDKPTQ